MIHVMCGISGSGKTTLSKQLALEHNAVLYCYDNFPRSHWMDDVHQTMYSDIVNDLKNNRIVICDDLHITKADRTFILEAISETDCKKILHVMLTSPNLCLERICNREKRNVPSNVIEYYCKRYDAPTLEEGWDEIIYHIA